MGQPVHGELGLAGVWDTPLPGSASCSNHSAPGPSPPPQACKFALRMCGPSMGCEGLRDMFRNHLREERGLHYGEFLNHVCKHLVSGRCSALPRPCPVGG